MAGVTAQAVSEQTGSTEVVRSIPNAAAAVRRSFTSWFATKSVSADSKRLVQALFEACGDAAEVPLEAHIDYCVGMTGSDAAFPALLAEALVAHAVEQGLPRSFAERNAATGNDLRQPFVELGFRARIERRKRADDPPGTGPARVADAIR